MKVKQAGFTLVELTIAVAFIGILLLAVVTTALALGHTYQRGTTMRDVNQAGREVMDSMRRDIAASSPSQLKVLLLPNAVNPETARVCTGSASYLINFASHLNSGSGQVIRAGTSSSSEAVRLMRVVDGGSANCTVASNGQYGLTVQGTNPQEMLNAQQEGGSNNVAVHYLQLSPIGNDDESKLYRLTLRIGTNDVDTTTDERCRSPQEDNENFDYCALYDFETIIRAGYRSED